MEELGFELELLKQLEKLEEPKVGEAKAGETQERSPTVSPYFSVQHERTGQLMNMFNDLDAVLQAVFSEEAMAEEEL